MHANKEATAMSDSPELTLDFIGRMNASDRTARDELFRLVASRLEDPARRRA
jgi:hypothetical protein